MKYTDFKDALQIFIKIGWIELNLINTFLNLYSRLKFNAEIKLKNC